MSVSTTQSTANEVEFEEEMSQWFNNNEEIKLESEVVVDPDSDQKPILMAITELEPLPDMSHIVDGPMDEIIPEKGTIVYDENGMRKKFNGIDWIWMCRRNGCKSRAKNINTNYREEIRGLCHMHSKRVLTAIRTANKQKSGKRKIKPKTKPKTKQRAIKTKPKPVCRPVTAIKVKPSLDINDVFEELTQENKRLFNELLFANNCLKLFAKFKAFVEFISNKFRYNLESNELRKYEEFIEKINEFVFKIKSIDTKTESDDYSVANDDDYMNFDDPIDNEEWDPMANYSGGTAKTKSTKKDLRKRVNGVVVKEVVPEVVVDERSERLRQRNELKDNEDYSVAEVINSNQSEAADNYESTSDSDSDYSVTEDRKRVKRPKAKHPHRSIVCNLDGCTVSYMDRTNFIFHQKNCHPPQRIKCHIHFCKFVATSADIYEEHSLTHENQQIYYCPREDCGRALSCQKNLNRHLKDHPTSSKPVFRCQSPRCYQTFRREGQLRYHERRAHPMEREYSCEWPGCDYKSRIGSRVKAHMDSHTLDYNVPCDHPGCSRVFKTTTVMHTHKARVHHKIRNHPCSWPGCTYRAFARTPLERHLLSHTKEKPFACDWPECQFRSSQKCNVKTHVMSVHQKKAFFAGN